MSTVIKIHDKKSFLDFLHSIQKIKPDFILLDGAMQTGKSTLIGPAVSFISRRHLIHLDDFTKENKNGIHSINKKLINKKIQKLSKKPIIEGIMIKKYAKILNLKNYYLIYIKSTNNGNWVEKEEYDTDLITEGYMKEPIYEKPSIYKQLYEYHKEYEPHKTADLILEIDQNILIKEIDII